jgi:pimeloyl-ACP methyl ester carboxylesterase
MHGMSQDCDADNGINAFIQQGFSMLTPSRPGYGKTPGSVGDSAEKAAKAMAELLNYLKIEKANVMAVSGGGPTAIYFAAKYPDKIRKLVLVSALSKPWQDKERYEIVKKFYGKSYPIMWAMLGIMSSLFPMMTARKTISLFSFHDPDDFMKHISKQEIDKLLRLYRSKAYARGPLIDLRSQPEVSVLNSIKAPTLIAHSKEDKSVEFENADYSANNIKSAELYVSPNGAISPGSVHILRMSSIK